MGFSIRKKAGGKRKIYSPNQCVIQSIAITENGPSRSPKTVDGDHRKRFIAIGGPAIRPPSPE
ncbi:MAG: hypothetical protein AB7O24_17910, partial [Kofleriaceae bacterium]